VALYPIIWTNYNFKRVYLCKLFTFIYIAALDEQRISKTSMDFFRFLNRPAVQKTMAFAVFVFWIVLFYQKVGLFSKIDDRPGGEHAWAQIDRASMALNYHNDQAPFLLPRCNQIDGNAEGITAGEFPLIAYSVSKMYDYWGFQERYHRLFVLGISLLGLLFTYLLALLFIKKPFWAAVLTSLWAASPNLIYYSFSFLPDSCALALLSIGIYFLLKNNEPIHTRQILLFSILSSLAILLKTSALFPFGAIVFAFMLTRHKSKMPDMKTKISFGIGTIIPLVLSFSWIRYAKSVVETYQIFTFLMEPTLPKSMNEIRYGMDFFLSFSNHYYIDGFWYFLFAATLVGLIFIRHSNTFLLLSALFIYASGYLFFLLLIQKSPHHFYYWVPFQLAVFFHLAWLFDLFLKLKVALWANMVLGTAFFIFLNYNAIHIHKNVNKRWTEGRDYFAKYYYLEPKLESLGIRYNDRVFSYQDETFNNSLYLMNRKGITESVANNHEQLNRVIQLCNYAVLSDTVFFENTSLRAHFGERMGSSEGLHIFKIKQR